MRSQDVAGSANIPYRRETFSTKRIVLDFDGDFNMAEAGYISGDARSKSMGRILHDLDSIREFNDSVGHQFFKEAKQTGFYLPALEKKDSLKVMAEVRKSTVNFDSLYSKLSPEQKQRVMKSAVSDAQSASIDLEFKGDYSDALNTNDRLHMIEEGSAELAGRETKVLTDEEMARIAALDKGRSAFFSHQDPAIVEWFGQMVEERKKANHHPASEKKAW